MFGELDKERNRSKVLADTKIDRRVDRDKLLVSENDNWAKDCCVFISRKMVVKVTGATADIGLLRKGDMSDGLKINRHLKWPERSNRTMQYITLMTVIMLYERLHRKEQALAQKSESQGSKLKFS